MTDIRDVRLKSLVWGKVLLRNLRECVCQVMTDPCKKRRFLTTHERRTRTHAIILHLCAQEREREGAWRHARMQAYSTRSIEFAC